MSMTIGKEAREALDDTLNRLGGAGLVCREVRDVLDRCTDADAPTCPHIVTSDEGTSHCRLAESGAGESVQEPVAFPKMSEETRAKAKAFIREYRERRTRPPVGLPHGWVMVPVEPTDEMLAATSWPECAATDYGHMLTAAPPCPGLVRLPEGWPWTDRIRRHVKALLLWEKEESDRMKDDEVSIPLANLARWIEHAGAADGEEGGGNE